MKNIFDFDKEFEKPNGPSIYSEIIEQWQRDALEKLQKFTDEEFNAFFAPMRWKGGYIVYPGMGPVISHEMKRRDPSGTRRWG